MQYTKRRNLNRGYMKLEVWQRGMDLFSMAFSLVAQSNDRKLRSQFVDAAQSVSANIAEGYGRRSLPEYLQFLYVAKGSLAETLTRAIGLSTVSLISSTDFEALDELHYEVENKLLHLISSLESKLGSDEWQTTLPPIRQSNNPSIHSSNHPLMTAQNPINPTTHRTATGQVLPGIQQSKNPSIQPSR